MSKEQVNPALSIAILVDGAFFLKRYRQCFKEGDTHKAKQVADNMYKMCMSHVTEGLLYRILYYDCKPLDMKMQHPITKKLVKLSETPTAIFRMHFLSELKHKRKVAIRLGNLRNQGGWAITPEKTKELLKNKIKLSELNKEDVIPNVKQKGVDIKIGLDIASLAYKKLVNRIVLISGDSDFVPALKLARREGIDVVLDPMWQKIHDDLFEHVDGLMSTCTKPKI